MKGGRGGRNKWKEGRKRYEAVKRKRNKGRQKKYIYIYMKKK